MILKSFTNLPDQSTLSTITFSDTVVANMPFSNDLFFYDLVNVEEDHQLAVPGSSGSSSADF